MPPKGKRNQKITTSTKSGNAVAPSLPDKFQDYWSVVKPFMDAKIINYDEFNANYTSYGTPEDHKKLDEAYNKYVLDQRHEYTSQREISVKNKKVILYVGNKSFGTKHILLKHAEDLKIYSEKDLEDYLKGVITQGQWTGLKISKEGNFAGVFSHNNKNIVVAFAKDSQKVNTAKIISAYPALADISTPRIEFINNSSTYYLYITQNKSSGDLILGHMTNMTSITSNHISLSNFGKRVELKLINNDDSGFERLLDRWDVKKNIVISKKQPFEKVTTLNFNDNNIHSYMDEKIDTSPKKFINLYLVKETDIKNGFESLDKFLMFVTNKT